MYQYIFIEMRGESKFNKYVFDESQDVIEKQAKEGWRFVGMIPKQIVGYGALRVMDLVFEKLVD